MGSQVLGTVHPSQLERCGRTGEAVGHIVPSPEVEREEQWLSPFLFSLGAQPTGWCHSHPRWGFPSSDKLLWKFPPDTSRYEQVERTDRLYKVLSPLQDDNSLKQFEVTSAAPDCL